MHKNKDGWICFDAGEEDIERRMLEATLKPMDGARMLLRIFLTGIRDLDFDSWQAWGRVKEIAREQGFLGAEDSLSYDYVQRGFRVIPRGDKVLKERLAFLEAEKCQAVAEKDFDGAGRLKEYADKLSARLRGDEAPPDAVTEK